ncbi:MAG TPA: heavy metal-binding domain-containing protein, partial [Candidatus Paceibacterota bacterium]|nr:heavy metal-binding domain-containing protein [Candidatus Paceibacterota bacterium]
MSASHDQHAHTCCNASTKHGPGTAAGQGSHEINQVPGAGLVDPVCGMSVKADSPHHAKHGGHDYRFCSAGCRSKFVADPARYLAPKPVAPEQGPAGTQYTCPMHPEIVRDAPGNCPICGMALEPMMPSLDDDENPELTDFRRRFWWTLPLSLAVLALAMIGHRTALLSATART